MFQIPVENLDNIRKVRKRVKGILVDVGLDSCRELLKDLKGFDPGEKFFYNTSWGDVSLWEPSGCLEMQIKTTLRFHLTSVQMVVIKNRSNNKCWQGCGEKLHTYVAGGTTN
uniref:ADNP zinc finger domain-containing protein n=1 Tax=Marmota marmota marmota TaxID=9994 RepID=A0A8C5ZVA2_MARMA